MLSYKIFRINVISLLLCLAACNLNSKQVSKNEEKYQSQKFVKDIPTTPTGKLYYPYQLIKETIPKVEIAAIENGFDSISIRFWFVYALGPWQIVEIKKQKYEWVCEYTLLTEDRNQRDSSVSLKKSTASKTPKSGWEKFINELLAKNFNTLPADFLIPNYQFNTDGDLFIVEIATTKSYRVFGYSSLSFNLNLEKARTMADKIVLIESEFGVELLNKEF